MVKEPSVFDLLRFDCTSHSAVDIKAYVVTTNTDIVVIVLYSPLNDTLCYSLEVALLMSTLLASVVHLDAHPNADQEVAVSIPSGCGNIISW